MRSILFASIAAVTLLLGAPLAFAQPVSCQLQIDKTCCVLDPQCQGSVVRAVFAYIADTLGEGCTVSNPQGEQASCTGVDDPGQPVSITITSDPVTVEADPNSGIDVTDPVTFASILGELPASLEFDVTGFGGTQSLAIHTSCSQPLQIGDRFGSMQLVELETTEGGIVNEPPGCGPPFLDQCELPTGGGEVEYQYTVTNPASNGGAVDNVSVDDDQLGIIVSGDILSIGETKTFFESSGLLTTTTNTATVSGDLGGFVCDPDMDTVTVTVPPIVLVSVDIKPGSDPNSIACNGALGTLIPVAILTTDTFDATTVDHETVTFEGAMEAHQNPHGMIHHEEDVDDDGDLDLVFHFVFGETSLTEAECSSTEPVEGVLTGETVDGQPIEGSDTVRLVLAFRGCGLGSGLVLLLPPVMWLYRWRRTRI
jgi:hypothetical protein